jgi:hypothetical protein
VGFALPIEVLRNEIHEAESKISEEKNGSKLLYTSREDGMETKGFSLEQDICKGIFSEFLQTNTCVLRNIQG